METTQQDKDHCQHSIPVVKSVPYVIKLEKGLLIGRYKNFLRHSYFIIKSHNHYSKTF